MNTHQKPVLAVESNIDSFYVQCLEPQAAAPTINVAAGDNVTVEVDLARPQAPVSVAIHDINAAAVNLCDLFGTATAQELIRQQSETAMAKPSLTFSPGPGWPGLVAAAYQQWTIVWNPLPLDGALYALDTVAAAHRNRAFDGARTARRYAEEALPAGRTLGRLLAAGQISELAVPLVRAAIEALDRNLLPGTIQPEVAYTLPLPLSELARNSILYPAEAMKTAKEGLLLTGSPDWRLSSLGLGLAATAEDTIQVTVHAKNPHAITITVPVGTAGTHDGYQAVITEPYTGSVISRSSLKRTGQVLRGHGLPVRPIKPTDHVDIQHPSLQARPEVDPQQRTIDRGKRDAARQLIIRRLDQLTYEGPLPTTLMELAQTGHLLAPAKDERLVDDLEIFLFTLLGNVAIATASRSTGSAIKKEWAEYTSTATGAKVYIDDRGDDVRIWLKDLKKPGQIHLEVVVSVTFTTPTGLQTAESNPTTISTRQPNHYVTVLRPLPGAAIDHVQVRIRPGTSD